MKRASISEAKNGLSALLDQVKAGVSVLIVDRGRPVARLEPVSGGAGDGARLEQLTRDGIVRPGRGRVPRALIASPPPAPTAGASAVAVLLEERRESR